MDDFRADLHCHSTCSDGTSTPTELIHLAATAGLQGLSITDHDSVAAYEEALPVAKQLGIPLVSGVEFSTHYEGANVHLLAYAFPLRHQKIVDLCQRHHLRRQERCRRMMALLVGKGIDLSNDQELCTALEQGSSVGRPHIAAALMRKGVVKSTEAAFRQFLGENCSCYVAMSQITTQETIDIIHEANGLAILAHPHLIKDPRLIQKLLHLPLDGVEAYYARFHRDRAQEWIALATKKDWIITGGSDYHGTIKPQIPLGASYVQETTFRMLQDHYQSNNRETF